MELELCEQADPRGRSVVVLVCLLRPEVYAVFEIKSIKIKMSKKKLTMNHGTEVTVTHREPKESIKADNTGTAVM